MIMSMKVRWPIYIFLFILVFSVATINVLANTELEDRFKNVKIPPLLTESNEVFYGARMQRTMSLLATSNEKQRRTVRILFYGQSIVRQPWWALVEKRLRERYPYAKLIVENRAIGGYMAPLLVRTAVHDLYPFYPDLVIFHVYGGTTSGELERIYRNIRKYTTADILTFTHHLYSTPNRDKADSADSKMIEYLAQKYNCELVDVRREWKRYLEYYDIKRTDYLCDAIHPNIKGCTLMAGLVLKHFKFNTLFNSQWYNSVKDFEARRFFEEKNDEIIFQGKEWKVTHGYVETTSSGCSLKLSFAGNRVVAVAPSAVGKFGSARVLIDGVSPSKIPEVYYATRPSKSLGMWWPALNRIIVSDNAIAEDWTLKITKINDDSSEFSYSVTGSITGMDGYGSSKETFVSNSGIITILPKDFTMIRTFKNTQKKYFAGFEIKWSVQGEFMDIWKAENMEDLSCENSYVLAQGLKNIKHTLEIIPNGDGTIALKSIRVYTPPLK